MEIIKFLILCFISLSFIGCQTTKTFRAPNQPVYELKEITPYKTVTDSLVKPKMPSMVFLTKNMEKTQEAKKAFYVAFNQEEFKKIIKVSQICNTQLDIIHKQDELVNSYIFQINQLILLSKQKDLRIKYLTENWENAENRYIEEENTNFKNKIVNTCVNSVLILTILALAI